MSVATKRMKFLPALTTMLLTAGLALQSGKLAAQAAESLSFAPLPMETPETVVAQWKPALDYMSKTLGTPLRIEYQESYTAILEKFRTGKLDLAYLGPLPYVTLKEQYPAAVPVVHFKEKDGQASYTCAIVSLAERQLTPKKLRNQKIALTQPLSTCGFLLTDSLLQRAGSNLEQNHYRYLDKHDAVAVAVARGDFDAGGLKTTIGRKYTHLGLEIIAESSPLPGFALIANGARLSPERIEQLRQALVEADAGQRASWGDNIRHGAVPAADKDYDVVRKLPGNRDIPEKGNF